MYWLIVLAKIHEGIYFDYQFVTLKETIIVDAELVFRKSDYEDNDGDQMLC